MGLPVATEEPHGITEKWPRLELEFESSKNFGRWKGTDCKGGRKRISQLYFSINDSCCKLHATSAKISISEEARRGNFPGFFFFDGPVLTTQYQINVYV
ncbi:MAG: hypothetical protein JWL90_2859 [Chthoniobacteraceae bacterium]|nr:hypothetical protein [Chthoniobacteraceae bacterium]